MNKKTIGISTLLVLTMISVAFAAVTAPTVKSIKANNFTDTSADITFTVNQKNVDTVVNYGIYGIGNIGIQSDWNNNTLTTRTITLSGLSNGTKYSYSIHACNGNSPSICSDSVA